MEISDQKVAKSVAITSDKKEIWAAMWKQEHSRQANNAMKEV